MVDVQQENAVSRRLQGKKDKAAKKSSGSGGGGGLLSGLTSPSFTSSIAETLEQQANIQARQAEQKSGLVSTGNPIESLVNDIMGQYASISVPATPFEQLQKLAEQQIASQFDPVIALLKNQMASKERRAGNSQREARAMYGDLSKDFLSQLPEMTNQYAAEDREANSRYDAAQQELQRQYGNQQNEQQAVLQQLGIQAAAPDASKQGAEDQRYFQGQMESEQQSAMNALQQQQTAQQDYQRNLGNTTAVAGENVAQDIRGQLEEYLDAANSQLSSTQMQRSSALGALLQQMQAQDADRVAKEEQQQFDNLMALSNFQLSAAKAAGDVESENQSLFGETTTGLQGAQNFLAEQYPDSPILASNLMQQLNDVLANPDVVKGKYVLEPGDPATGKAPRYSDVGQEMMMDLLRREIEKENQATPGRYSSGDVNTAINALMAYMGKLR